MTSQELIEKYWRSWQEPSDFDEMLGCLAPDVHVDMGVAKFESAAGFRDFVAANPVPWEAVEAIDSVYTTDAGAMIYEGTNTATGRRMRVSEILKVENGAIQQITTVLSELPES